MSMDGSNPDTDLHPDEQAFALRAVEARIIELARLTALDYEPVREAEAKALGLRVSVLDREVELRRAPRPGDADAADPFEAVEPWPAPVDGAALLSELQASILRFCILPDHSPPQMAVWVLHAWAHEAADISPLLAFVSPEKRCGKSTALSIIGALTPKAMHNVNITTSVLFRVIELHKPTVLIDEADTFLAENEELRGILNGGHNRLSAYVWRSVGDDHEPRRFKVWAPKCIAMIGKLPDTLEDRALVVPLRRKQAGEVVERFRADRVADFLPLRRMAARWAADNLMRLRELDAAVPEALHDRAQDNARAICAIADLAGGIWPDRVRGALVGLAGQSDDEPQSAGVLLLRDIAEILERRTGDKIGSTDLCAELCALEESPWPEWRRGSPITARGVAKLLKPFGIKPNRDRAGSYYPLRGFADALDRYLPATPEETATSATRATDCPSATEKSKENKGGWQNGTGDTCPDPEAGKHHGGATAADLEDFFQSR